MKKLSVSFAATMLALAAGAETIAYWPFGENGLNDVSGNGNHLEADGHISLANDNCATLDGAQGLFSTIKALEVGSAEALTLEFWIKFDRSTAIANSNPFIIFEWSENFSSSDYSFLFDYNEMNGTMLGAWKVSNGYLMSVQNGDTAGDNEWHHVAMILNPKGSGNNCCKLYVDGSEYVGGTGYNTAPQSIVNWPSGQKVYIGSRANNSYRFLGQIDDVKISSGTIDPFDFTVRSSGAEASPDKIPAFGSIVASAATETTVTFAGNVAYIGYGATEATVSAVDCGVTNVVGTFASAGQFTYQTTGMAKGSERTVEFILSNDVARGVASKAVKAQTVREDSTVIAYYSFDDEDVTVGAGNGHDVLADKSGNGNSLWMSGVGVMKGCARLSGSQTYFSASELANNRINYIPYLEGNDAGRAHMTIEIWAKITAEDNASGEAMFVETSGSCGYEGNAYNLYYNNGTIVATVSHPGNWTYSSCAVPFVPDGGWHHFALVVNPDIDAVSYDANAGQLKCAEVYIDSELKGMMNWSFQGYGDMLYHAIAFYNPTFFVGSRANSQCKLAGEIDDLRISSGALVPGQFAARTPIDDAVYPQPVLDSLNVGAIEQDSVELSVTLSAIGEGAAYCDLFAVYMKGDTVVTQAISRVTEPATESFSVLDLEESTAYEFTVCAKNDIYDDVVSIVRSVTTRQAPKPLLYYTFDEKDVESNGLVADHSTQSVYLQTNGSVRIDGQATLDGASTIWNHTGFSYGDINVLTAECFAKFDAEDNTGASMLIGGSGEPGYMPGTFHLYFVGGETPQVRITITYQGNWDCNTASANFTPDGKWHHFAIVVDPSEGTGKAAYLYIDYELAASLDWPKNGSDFKPFSFGWSTISIGSIYNDYRYYFTGQIDDVRVYNRALAPAQFLRQRTKGYNPFMLIIR